MFKMLNIVMLANFKITNRMIGINMYPNIIYIMSNKMLVISSNHDC